MLGERWLRRLTNSLAPPTRHRHYNGDKLSRLAPSSELSERHSFCGIISLAKGRTLGAYVAGTIGELPNLPTEGAGFKRRTPGALIVLALVRAAIEHAQTQIAARKRRHPARV